MRRALPVYSIEERILECTEDCSAGQKGSTSYRETLQAVGEVLAPAPTPSGFQALCSLRLPAHPEMRGVFVAFLARNPPSATLAIPLGLLRGWLDAMYPTLQALLSPAAGESLLLTSPYSRAACGMVL